MWKLIQTINQNRPECVIKEIQNIITYFVAICSFLDSLRLYIYIYIYIYNIYGRYVIIH
jgi:hypothetical protein